MTTKEAAKLLGCSPQHVRTLIRQGRLKVKPAALLRGFGYFKGYEVNRDSVEQYKNLPRGRGRPRGPLKRRKKK